MTWLRAVNGPVLLLILLVIAAGIWLVHELRNDCRNNRRH